VAFKEDDEATRTRDALVAWVDRLADGDLETPAADQELHDLLTEYGDHLELLDRQFERGTMRTLVKMPLAVTEGLIRHRDPQLVASEWDLAPRKSELTDAEWSAPGKEVAYVADATSGMMNSY